MTYEGFPSPPTYDLRGPPESSTMGLTILSAHDEEKNQIKKEEDYECTDNITNETL